MKSSGIAAVLVIAVLWGSLGATATDDVGRKAEALLRQADARVASLHDFKANLKARAQFPLLPAVNLTGHLYFKRPDHLKVDVDHLPHLIQQCRQNLQVQPSYHNRKAYVMRYIRTEPLEGRQCDVIGFHAKDAANRLQHATIWLERTNGTIPRSILEYADGTLATLTTTYAPVGRYMLPQTSDIVMQLPAMRAAAQVTYSDYALNTNLPDSVFAQE